MIVDGVCTFISRSIYGDYYEGSRVGRRASIAIAGVIGAGSFGANLFEASFRFSMWVAFYGERRSIFWTCVVRRFRVIRCFVTGGIQRFSYPITLFYFQQDCGVSTVRILGELIGYSDLLFGVRVHEHWHRRLTLAGAHPVRRFGDMVKWELVRRRVNGFGVFIFYPGRRFAVFLFTRASYFLTEVFFRVVMPGYIIGSYERLVIGYFRVRQQVELTFVIPMVSGFVLPDSGLLYHCITRFRLARV